MSSYIESKNISNANNQTINPSTEEAITLLRRLVQIASPLSTQDSNQRLRVTIDSITGSLTLSTITTVGTVNTVTTVGTVNTVSSVTNFGASATLPNLTGLGGGTGFSVDARYMFIDAARNAYANGIRSNLSFS